MPDSTAAISEVYAESVVQNHEGLFVLGVFASRVTLYAQQVRALCLVHDLTKLKKYQPNMHVAVIGGGAAGLTVSAALALADPGGCRIDLFERRNELIHLQRESGRYLHPRLFEWPESHLDDINANLPILNWSAGAAGVVARTINDAFNDIKQKHPSLHVIHGTKVTNIKKKKYGGYDLEKDGLGSCTNPYDLVILAIGFGVENKVDLGAPSYWSPDAYGPVRAAGDKVEVFVSGNGDGGLIDFIGKAFSGMDHVSIVDFIAQSSNCDGLHRQLLDIEARAWQEGDHIDIKAQYQTLLEQRMIPTPLLLQAERRLRQETAITWHTNEKYLFRRDTALLNRLGAFLALAADENSARGHINIISDKPFVKCPASYPIEILGGRKPFVPTVRLLRFGPNAVANLTPFAPLLGIDLSTFKQPKPETKPMTPVLASDTHTYFKELAAGKLPAIEVPQRSAEFDYTAFEQNKADLLEATKATLNRLKRYSRLSLLNRDIRISRKASQPLREAARHGSLLVIGAAGSGKSGLLYNLAATLERDGNDLVYFSCDKLDGAWLPVQQRRLELSADLLETLRHWNGSSPAYLVIDSLDAARGEDATSALRELIAQLPDVAPRWHVICSMRTFDLLHDAETRSLFAGEPVSKPSDARFKNTRHVLVAPLDDDELRQVAVDAPTFQQAIEGASNQLRDLLRNPFNLGLAIELFASGEALTPDDTWDELDLLERFWLRRVLPLDGRDARRQALGTVCQAMIEARRLKVDRATVTASEPSAVIDALTRDDVLEDWSLNGGPGENRYALGFSHHIFFDFAGSELLRTSVWQDLASKLAFDPSLLIFLAPSLILYLKRLWRTDVSRSTFRHLTASMFATTGVPEIARAMVIGQVVDLARTEADLAWLVDWLTGTTVAPREAIECVNALATTISTQANDLDESRFGLWLKFCATLLEVRPRESVPAVTRLLGRLCERSEEMSTEQLESANAISRRLFTISTTDPERTWAPSRALQLVCETIRGGKEASVKLIYERLGSA